MKKIILTFALALGLSSAMFAPAKGETIGLRFGYPTEISYQKGLNSVNRLEFGLGFRAYTYYSTFSASGVYQWVKDLPSVTENLSWYYGAGASVGYWSYSGAHGLPISVLGQVGLQYKFKFPLLLSLDWRPAFQVTDGAGFVGDGICLGVRYILK